MSPKSFPKILNGEKEWQFASLTPYGSYGVRAVYMIENFTIQDGESRPGPVIARLSL